MLSEFYFEQNPLFSLNFWYSNLYLDVSNQREIIYPPLSILHADFYGVALNQAL